MKNIMKLITALTAILGTMAILSACTSTPSGSNAVTRQPANPSTETQSTEMKASDTQAADAKTSDTQATANQPAQAQIVGGDRDEHGCIGSAGYTWCEAKQKCFRSWEEECVTASTSPASIAAPAPAKSDSDITGSSEESGIKAALAKEYDKPVSDITLRNQQISGDFARGGVTIAPGGQGEGGMFLAVKKNDEWTLVYAGNGSVDCKAIKEYGFPAPLLQGFCD